LGPRYGRITINSLPWATVYVDGKPIGVTPIRDKRLRAGQHHIVLKDRQGRILKAFTTHVVTGQERVHSFLFKRR